MFDPNFCSKHFSITPDELFRHLVDQKNIPITLSEANDFIKNIYNHGDSTDMAANSYAIRDLGDLSSIIKKSFITAVSETVADSYVPFPTEKICFPIVNKSLWIAYAQPNYYKFIEKYMNLKPYVGIDYSFDEILNPTQRLDAVIEELKRLRLLSDAEKESMYQSNQSIIDHNFTVLTSGEMIVNLWLHDECPEHYLEISKATTLGGFVNRNIVSNIIDQLLLVNNKLLEREKHFRQSG
jgi:hypothetical protein